MTKAERLANAAILEAVQLQHEAERPGATAEAIAAYRRAHIRAAELTAAALSGAPDPANNGQP